MRKIILLLAVMAISIALIGCRKKNQEPVNHEPAPTAAVTQPAETQKETETAPAETREMKEETSSQETVTETEEETETTDEEQFEEDTDIPDWGGREDELPIG